MFWQEPWRGILKIVSCQFLINVVAQNLDLPRLPPLPCPICPPPHGRWEAELRGGRGGSGWDTELHSLVLIYNRVKCSVLGDNAAYRQDMVSTRCHQPSSHSSLLTLGKNIEVRGKQSTIRPVATRKQIITRHVAFVTHYNHCLSLNSWVLSVWKMLR